MKKIGFIFCIGLASLSSYAQTKPTTTAKKPVAGNVKAAAPAAAKPTNHPVTLKVQPVTNLDSASYAFGFSMASQLKASGVKSVNFDLLKAAFSDVFAENPPLLTQEQSRDAITHLFEKIGKEKEEAAKVKYAETIQEGEAFLQANAKKEGIQTTESGLQYEILEKGKSDKKPVVGNRVTVHYQGKLLNGHPFDSSYERGEPATFGLTQVIKGWTEGLQLMNEGAKYRFFLPYQLGYGASGTPNGDIPPFSVLVFEVELIKIEE